MTRVDQCVEMLISVHDASNDPGLTYVLPSRLQRAVHFCQRFIAERSGMRIPLLPANRIEDGCVPQSLTRIAELTNLLASESTRFQFMSEALQEVMSRNERAIAFEVDQLISEMGRLPK